MNAISPLPLQQHQEIGETPVFPDGSDNVGMD